MKVSYISSNNAQYRCEDCRSDPNVTKPLTTAIPAQNFSHDILLHLPYLHLY